MSSELAQNHADSIDIRSYAPDAGSEEHRINEWLLHHPLVEDLIQNKRFNASRPHLSGSLTQRQQSLTKGALLGSNLIVVPPLAFVKPDGSEYFAFLYLGAGLCGWPGFVHGGLLATLMDEGLAGCAFPTLKGKLGVTASLTIDFKRPCRSEQFVMIQAQTEKTEDGKRAWVHGKLHGLAENVRDTAEALVEANALYVSVVLS